MKIKTQLKKVIISVSLSIILFGNISPILVLAKAEKANETVIENQIQEETNKDLLGENNNQEGTKTELENITQENITKEEIVENQTNKKQEQKEIIEKDNEKGNIQKDSEQLENFTENAENIEEQTELIQPMSLSSTVPKSQTKNFNVSLFNYNTKEFNDLARNGTYDKASSSDRTLLVYYNDDEVFRNAYQGYANEFAPSTTSDKGVTQGIIGSTLVNGNITYNYANANDMVFFPTTSQAEGRNLVGNNKPYKEIYRNVQMPFMKESSGYYSFDSTKYSMFLDRSSNVLDLYENAESRGFFPFNDVNDDLKEKWVAGGFYEEDTGAFNPNKSIRVYHFGVNIEVPFYMTKDGKTVNKQTGNLEDIVFSFSGDDDVWVFVDNKLVLDMGGVHTNLNGNINFATNRTYISAVNDITKDPSKVKKDVYTNNVFGGSRLSEGDHTLRIFYMERARGASNFSARFNLPQDIKDIKGTIKFKDNNNTYNTRPENCILKLYADGKYLKQKTINLQNYSTQDYTFNDLQVCDESTGKKINYTTRIDNISLDNGDKYVVSQSGFNATLTLSGTTNIKVKKQWEDANNKYQTRPDKIKVRLLKKY